MRWTLDLSAERIKSLNGTGISLKVEKGNDNCHSEV